MESTDAVSPRRLAGLLLVLTAVLFGLIVRLAWWQLARGNELGAMAIRQRALSLPLEPARGDIVDRVGRPLVGLGWERVLVALPGLIDDPSATARSLGRAIGTPQVYLLSRLVSAGPLDRQLVLAGGLTDQQAQAVDRLGLPGVFVVPRRSRYTRLQPAAHLIGYLNDGTGAAGLERRYDAALAFEGPAAALAFVNGVGELIPGLGLRVRPAVADVRGRLALTIDLDLQTIVEDEADRLVPRGAVVVVDAWTGDVLALTSRPRFDSTDVSAALDRSDGALLNRALLGYPPGSVWKVVVALAGLEAGKVRLEDTFICQQAVRVGDREFACWPDGRPEPRTMTFSEALARSWNPAFVELAVERLGWEPIRRMAVRLGLGEPTGLDLPAERPGQVPLVADSPGDLANMAIGQGRILATPAALARMMAAIAVGGRLRPLRVVRSLREQGGEDVPAPSGPPVQVVSEASALALQRALVQAAEQGSGRAAWLAGWGSGGKTGTAETGRPSEEGGELLQAWFVGFAPAERPRLVAAILVEGGTSGPESAAPVFRRIMERALELDGLLGASSLAPGR